MTETTKPDYSTLDFPPAPPERPYVLLNMVMSTDGQSVIERTERGLGSQTDQRLMRELRVGADIVLNGASTLRASGSTSRVGDASLEAIRRQRGKPPNPIAAVLSASGELPLQRPFFTARDFDAVVYLSARAPRVRHAAIAATGRPVHSVPAGDEVRAMLRHMRQELGTDVLLVEGGPILNGKFVAGGWVDEYFLTLGPVIVSGHNGAGTVTGRATASLSSVTHLALVSAIANPATDEVYLRYRTRHGERRT